jgi:hypothetical protein
MSANLEPDILSIAFATMDESSGVGPGLSFSVFLSANFSEAMSLSLLYWAVNNEQSWITLSRTSALAPFTGQVQLPVFAKSGAYEIRAISARDNNGTHLSLSRDQLQSLGHVVSTNLTNPSGDEMVPELISFEAGQPYWASDGSLHVDLAVTASDAGSGLKPNFVVELTSPTGVSLQQWASFDADGRAVVDFLLPRYAPTGSYEFNTVRLTDKAGNYSASQPWLASNPRAVQVVNPEGDSVAPEVSTFTLRAVYDPQTHRPKIAIKGLALDMLSGVGEAYARFISPEGLILDAPWMPVSELGDGKFAFEDYKALSTEFTSGIYQVQFLFVQDSAGNRTTLASELQNPGPLQGFVRVYFPSSGEQTRIQASSGADFIFGTDLAAETLEGGGGNDYLYSGAGDDRVDAGEGDDSIIGGAGAGNDIYLGGPGIDQVIYSSSTTSITIDLEAGTASGNEIGTDSLSGIENIIGGQAGDILRGDALANDIDGYTGDDLIEGAGGDDTLSGGVGDDSILGGDGFDIARFAGVRADYTITWSATNSTFTVISDLEGTDTLSGIEGLSFSDGTIPVLSFHAAINPPPMLIIDTIWPAGSVVNLTGDVQIAPGVILIVEPGVTIKANGNKITAYGTLDLAGTQSAPIKLDNAVVGFGSSSSTPGNIQFDWVEMATGSFLAPTGYGGYGRFDLADSSFTDVNGFYIWYPTGPSTIARNVFDRSEGLSIGTSQPGTISVTNNVFANQTGGAAVEVWANYNNGITVSRNSFLSTDRVAIELPTGYSSASLIATNNFFGTDSVSTINAMILDRSDSLERASVVDYLPLLTRPDVSTPMYPVTLKGHAYHWKNHALLSDTAVIVTGVEPAITDAAGRYTLDLGTSDAVTLDVSRPVGDGGPNSGITSADALAALRIAVGLNPNPVVDGVRAPISPYQIIAADVNQSGTVTSADALAILRMAVKLSTATPQEWLFVEESRDLWDELALDGQGGSALTRTAAAWDRAIGASPQDTADVNLVGILKGDVNGSWTPPADAIELGPAYFQDLASLMGVPENYWG